MADYTTNTIQAGDVLLFHENDRGNIREANGYMEMTQGYETMLYLSHFGGNEDDNGSEATAKKQYWGNEGEPPERQLRARLQSQLSGRPLTSASLVDIAAAALEDLERDFVTPGHAESAEIESVELVTAKHVRITESLTFPDGTVMPFTIESRSE